MHWFSSRAPAQDSEHSRCCGWISALPGTCHFAWTGVVAEIRVRYLWSDAVVLAHLLGAERAGLVAAGEVLVHMLERHARVLELLLVVRAPRLEQQLAAQVI